MQRLELEPGQPLMLTWALRLGNHPNFCRLGGVFVTMASSKDNLFRLNCLACGDRMRQVEHSKKVCPSPLGDWVGT